MNRVDIVSVEKGKIKLMVAESWILLGEVSLVNSQSGSLWSAGRIPVKSEDIQRRSKYPILLPFFNSVIGIGTTVVRTNRTDKIVDSTIVPSECVKVIRDSFEEILLSHQEY